MELYTTPRKFITLLEIQTKEENLFQSSLYTVNFAGGKEGKKKIKRKDKSCF